MSELTRDVITYGAPYSDLVIIKDIPYLVSQAIEGPTLHDVLFETDAFTEYCQTHDVNPEDFDLSLLDETSVMNLLLISMIICPEDGLPANYIVERKLDGSLHIVCVDNENAFAPDMAREEQGKIAVQVRTVLYCLDQMTQQIPEAVIKRFTDFNPLKIIGEWLRSLSGVHTRQFEMITAQHLELEDFYPGVPFRRGMIRDVYDRFIRLQEALRDREEGEEVTPLTVLEDISPVVAKRYRQGHNPALKWSVSKRFEECDAPSFREGGSQDLVSTTTATALLSAQGHSVQGVENKQTLLQALKKEHDMGPTQGLEELNEIRSYKEGDFVESLQRCPTATELESLLKKTDFGQFDEVVQRLIFAVLTGGAPSPVDIIRVLTLRNAKSLDNTCLKPLIRKTLTHLNLPGTQITEKSLTTLSHLPHLIRLDLSRCNKLKTFAEWGYVVDGIIYFKALQYLYLNHCESLKAIWLEAPELLRLEIEGCAQLNFNKVSVSSPQLRYSNLKHNEKLTDPVLDSLVLGHFYLRALSLEGCPLIAERAFREECPLYCSSIPLGDDVRAFFRNDEALQSLQLGERNIGADEAASLGGALRVNSTLQRLILSFNNIGASGAASLGDALRVNTGVTTLDLTENTIGDSGAVALGEALRVNSTLLWLNLNNNNIGASGAASLGDALRVNTGVTTLSLKLNKIGDSGAASVGGALRVNSTLLWLSLDFNNIGASGAASLGDALRVNTGVTTLALSGNKIGDSGAASLVDALRVNTGVTTLALSENNIGADGKAALDVARRSRRNVTIYY